MFCVESEDDDESGCGIMVLESLGRKLFIYQH